MTVLLLTMEEKNQHFKNTRADKIVQSVVACVLHIGSHVSSSAPCVPLNSAGNILRKMKAFSLALQN